MHSFYPNSAPGSLGPVDCRRTVRLSVLLDHGAAPESLMGNQSGARFLRYLPGSVFPQSGRAVAVAVAITVVTWLGSMLSELLSDL